MTAPKPLRSNIALIPGAIIRGVDLLRAYGLDVSDSTQPASRLIPVRIVKNGAAEIEVGGRRYRQVVSMGGCRDCSAGSVQNLCDVICPYCKDGQVFVARG